MDAFMAVDGVLARRHSCRAFRPDPVPRAQIEQALTAAGRSASWCNAQPWGVWVVSGPPLEALRAAMLERARQGAAAAPELDWPRQYVGVYRDRRRECGWRLYEAVGVAKGDRQAAAVQSLENFRFFGAPHLLLVTSPEDLGTHGVMDCGAWVSNFMLAATALGLGTIAQAAVASWPDILRAHVSLPEDHRIVCGISLGFEDTEHPANRFRTGRAALDESVRWVGEGDS